MLRFKPISFNAKNHIPYIPMVHHLTLVDKDDKVIGHGDYDKIHSQGLLHRFVLVYVFDNNGRLFLQRRSTTKPHGGLLAESVCAHVRYGEDYIQTAKRRINEELGIGEQNIRSLTEITKTHVYTEEKNWKNYAFVMIYECKIVDANLLSINESEISGGSFHPLEKIRGLFYERPESFVPGFRKTFQAYLDAKGIQ